MSGQQKITKADADAIFEAFDENGDGTISKGELKKVLRQLLTQCNEDVDEATVDSFAQEVIAEADKMGESDGKISKSEFYKLLNV